MTDTPRVDAVGLALYDLRELARQLERELAKASRALHEIAEEWAGAECGEPVHAQEAYAIGLAKRMYTLAVEGLAPNAMLSGAASSRPLELKLGKGE